MKIVRVVMNIRSFFLFLILILCIPAVSVAATDLGKLVYDGNTPIPLTVQVQGPLEKGKEAVIKFKLLSGRLSRIVMVPVFDSGPDQSLALTAKSIGVRFRLDHYYGGLWKKGKVKALQFYLNLGSSAPANVLVYAEGPAEKIDYTAAKRDNITSTFNNRSLGVVKNFGTGKKKTGGQYLSIPVEEIIKPNHGINIKNIKGTFEYVMIHARYPRGIWKNIYLANDRNENITATVLKKKITILDMGEPTHLIFTINGRHENYSTTKAEATINLFEYSTDGKPVSKVGDRKVKIKNDKGVLGTIENFGTGVRKKGGRYLSVKASDVLKPGKSIYIIPDKGRFESAMIHARYNGGIWKSVYKITQANEKVTTDKIISKVRAIGRGEPTNIIFSVNGEHERYTTTAASAIVKLESKSGNTVKAPKPVKVPAPKPAKSNIVKALGCFQDTGSRDLNGFFFTDNAMTTDKCVQTCRAKGFKYAGTQYTSQCFCGNTYGKYGPAVGCNMPCGGNGNEICGGSWAMNIYQIK